MNFLRYADICICTQTIKRINDNRSIVNVQMYCDRQKKRWAKKKTQTDEYPHRGNNKPGASYSLWLWLQQQHNDDDACEDCVLLYYVVQEFRLTEFQGGLVKLRVHF